MEWITLPRCLYIQINTSDPKGIHLSIQFLIQLPGFDLVAIGANALDAHLLPQKLDLHGFIAT